MATFTVRNLDDRVHQKLKIAAKENNRSTEAEIRSLLTSAMMERYGGGLGTMMREVWGDHIDGALVIERSTEGPRAVNFE